MNRLQLIEAACPEFLRAGGNTDSSGDLLDYTDDLVDTFTEESLPRFDLRVGGRSFDEWALDAVFADGGWRVLDRCAIFTFGSDDKAVNDPITSLTLEELGLEMCA